jgi:hypothetical protein
MIDKYIFVIEHYYNLIASTKAIVHGKSFKYVSEFGKEFKKFKKDKSKETFEKLYKAYKDFYEDGTLRTGLRTRSAHRYFDNLSEFMSLCKKYYDNKI